MKNSNKEQKKIAEMAIKEHIKSSLSAEMTKINDEYGGKIKKLDKKANKIAKWLSKKIKIDKLPALSTQAAPAS
jgi:flagellar biosynthesis GTPase FlhF